jgi:imidazolonepropionase-like amidohydrolase
MATSLSNASWAYGWRPASSTPTPCSSTLGKATAAGFREQLAGLVVDLDPQGRTGDYLRRSPCETIVAIELRRHLSAAKSGREAEVLAGEAVRFTNVDVFDSVAGKVIGPFHVTVRDGLIESVVSTAGAGSDDFDGTTVDGSGKTLMPGLIDAHWHTIFTTVGAALAATGEVGYVFAQAVVSARDTLLRGFTTVRDVGGPSFGIKQAVDEGLILGPRIYPSGAFISQTGGHGDFRLPNEVPRGIGGHLGYSELIGAAVIADGEAEVLRGAREVLRRGASQLKVMAGGGVATDYDPIDVSQYTEREIRAAVGGRGELGHVRDGARLHP